MRIGRWTNGISCEFRMQEKMKEWLIGKKLPFVDEFTVPNLGRRADFLLIKDALINIEAKCNDFSCLIRQLRSHAMYCDYCFAFIPDYSMTPIWFKKSLIENGFGLIIFNYENDIITEVLEAHHNKERHLPMNKSILKMVYELYKKNLEININKQLSIDHHFNN